MENVNTGTITAQENVVIGNNNNIFYSKEGSQCWTLQVEIQELERQFDEIKVQDKKYPLDSFFQSESIRVSGLINSKKEVLRKLIKEIQDLAEQLSTIPLATERLKQAKLFFESGEFEQARGILNAEILDNELSILIEEKTRLKQKTDENNTKLKHTSNEFLILAQLTTINHSIPNWLDVSKLYYQKAISAYPAESNILSYGKFLLWHNKVDEALSQFQIALSAYRSLAVVDSSIIPELVKTLDFICRAYDKVGRLAEARALLEEAIGLMRSFPKEKLETLHDELAGLLNSYCVILNRLNLTRDAMHAIKESLKIYRPLLRKDFEKYADGFATSLVNYAHTLSADSDLAEAEKVLLEALETYRLLAEKKPEIYKSSVAGTLNNLGSLYHGTVDFLKHEKALYEALEIYKMLAENNPQTYLANVAMVYNSIGGLHSDNMDFKFAIEAYRESSKLYSKLAIASPETFNPNVAYSLNNLGNVLRLNEEYEEAEAALRQALELLRPVCEINPQTYLPVMAKLNCQLAHMYASEIIDETKAIAFANECIRNIEPFVGRMPNATQLYEYATYIKASFQLPSNENDN